MPSLIKDAFLPLIASAAAIAVSPILQLLTGQGMFYSLWLSVLMVALWMIQRLTNREVGVSVGDAKSYFAVVIYLAAIIGSIALGAWVTQLVDLTNYSGSTVLRRLTLNFIITFALALVTEEGFFRGALWGSCMRAGFSPAKTIICTSLAFGLWHIAVPIIDPDFAQSMSNVPQYVLGSTAFGFAMGLLRFRSGSIVVPSVCHALWNASVYTFFGAGKRIGQLGVSNSNLWDPERGIAGLALAVIGAVLLWLWVRPSAAGGRVS